MIRWHILTKRLHLAVKEARLGNYAKMRNCFRALVNARLNLETCGIDDLEAIPGIGCKTSRYFLMYTRPDIQTETIAVIDTHTWKWVKSDPWAAQRLAELGVKKLPKTPPSDKKRYKVFEQVIVEDAKRKGISTRQWDASNWDEKSAFSDVARARALKAGE